MPTKSSSRKSAKEPRVPQWRDWLVKNSSILLFALKFGGSMAVLYILLALPIFDQWLYSYLKVNAWLSGLILNLFGQHTHVSDVTIQSPEFAVAIRRGCDAVEPTWLFCAAILSFPGAFSRKIIGILGGIILLQILNLVRIVTLFWIGIHWPSVFNSFHMEIWPTAFIVVSILFFVGWIDWSARQSNHQHETK